MPGIYIYAKTSDWSEVEEKVLDEAFYGPFSADEEETRLFDAFADQLEASGSELYTVELNDKEEKKYHINPREFWMAQLAKLTQETTDA